MQQLCENTYKERLKHNKIKEGFESLEKNKITLCKERLEEASRRKTEPEIAIIENPTLVSGISETFMQTGSISSIHLFFALSVKSLGKTFCYKDIPIH